MTASISLGRADGGFDTIPSTLTPLAVQTTLVAGTTQIVSGLAFVTPIAGSTAVALTKNCAPGSPIVVVNNAATAVTLLVFPPWDNVAVAAAGGKIYGSVVGPAANASQSIAQGKSASFWPHPNGIDFTCVLGS